MIKVRVIKEKDKIKKINIKGHANFNDFGKDIVCASVSSIVITTVNAIERIDKDAITYTEKDFNITVLKDDDVINKLIINMISLLEELENSYPKNIKFL